VAVARLVEQRGLSQVRACRLVGLNRSSWRRLNGAHLLSLVRGGAKFVDGVRQDRPPQVIQPTETEPREAA